MSKRKQQSSSNNMEDEYFDQTSNILNTIQNPNQLYINKIVHKEEKISSQKESKIKIETEHDILSQSKVKQSKSRRKHNEKVENKQKQSLSHINSDRPFSSSRSNSESMGNSIRNIEVILSQQRKDLSKFYQDFSKFHQDFKNFVINQGNFNAILMEKLNIAEHKNQNLQIQVIEKLEDNYTLQKDVAQFALKDTNISQNQRLVKNLITSEQKDQSYAEQHNLRSSSKLKKK